MMTAEQAIEKAFTYLKTLPPEYLGAPESPRLETIQRFDDEWVVILSYLTKTKRNGDVVLNPLLEAMSYQRYFKEFDIDATSGEITAMINPEARELTKPPLPKNAS